MIESPFGIAAGAFTTGVQKSAAESRVSVTPNALNEIGILNRSTKAMQSFPIIAFLRDNKSTFPYVWCIIHDSAVEFHR